LGLVSVLVGVAAAGQVVVWRLIAALVVSAGLQIGVNFANDYFDGVRGVETTERLRGLVSFAHYPPAGLRGIGAERLRPYLAFDGRFHRRTGEKVINTQS